MVLMLRFLLAMVNAMVVKKLFSSSFGEDEAKNLIMKNYRSVVTGIDNACENGGLDFAGDLFEVLFGDARVQKGA